MAQVYGTLRDLIVWSRLAPGTWIVETEVARRLGTSRARVRSALQRLQQEGYVLAPDDGKRFAAEGCAAHGGRRASSSAPSAW